MLNNSYILLQFKWYVKSSVTNICIQLINNAYNLCTHNYSLRSVDIKNVSYKIYAFNLLNCNKFFIKNRISPLLTSDNTPFVQNGVENAAEWVCVYRAPL